MEKKERKRYSEAFKLHVMEELRDGKWKTPTEAAMAYGMPSQNVRNWMRRLGFEHLKGRLIYVKAASEIDEIKRLKAENRRLKEQLADEVLDHRIDEAALEIACGRLNTTPDELKKRLARGDPDGIEEDKAFCFRDLQADEEVPAGVLQGGEGTSPQGCQRGSDTGLGAGGA